MNCIFMYTDYHKLVFVTNWSLFIYCFEYSLAARYCHQLSLNSNLSQPSIILRKDVILSTVSGSSLRVLAAAGSGSHTQLWPLNPGRAVSCLCDPEQASAAALWPRGCSVEGPHNGTLTDWWGTRVLAFLGHWQTNPTQTVWENHPFYMTVV